MNLQSLVRNFLGVQLVARAQLLLAKCNENKNRVTEDRANDQYQYNSNGYIYIGKEWHHKSYSVAYCQLHSYSTVGWLLLVRKYHSYKCCGMKT